MGNGREVALYILWNTQGSGLGSVIGAASMARKIYLRKGIGVGGFCKIYGGRKSSGSIDRHILQQLEMMNIVEMDPNGGWRITSSGQRDLDRLLVILH